jgi:pSer/pThr/pTyr-binding forkhead associated (FHA) protein
MKSLLRLFEVRKGQRLIKFTDDYVSVGRDREKCDIVLDELDTLASRTHFRIKRERDYFVLEDSSRNGTWVNGERIGKLGRRLYHGDVIEAGNAEITLFLSDDAKTPEQLFAEGKSHEVLNPSYSIQCYSLAHEMCPANIEYAFHLLDLLEREGRFEDLITGGTYFSPQEMMELGGDVRIAAPIARAFVRIGDFVQAMEVVKKAGGKTAESMLAPIVQNIEHQTSKEILKTIVEKTAEIPFFQRGNLKIFIEERADFVDLRYVERYYKYLQQRIDPLFGAPAKSEVVFHVTDREHLFALSLPNQAVVLGYYSPDSKRIFIRPRRWMEGRINEENFHIVLTHEYVHFRVDDICSGMDLPRWYNEGLAQILSENKRSGDYNALSFARHKCQHIMSFSDASFLPVCADLGIAYLQSSAVLFYLMKRFGKKTVLSVLVTMMESGGNFQRSFESTFGMSLEELDRNWWSVLEDV